MEFLLIILTSSLFIALVVSAIALIVGLAKPDLILRFKEKEKRNKKGVVLTFGPIALVSLGLLMVLGLRGLEDTNPPDQAQMQEEIDEIKPTETLRLTDPQKALFLKEYGSLTNPDIIQMIEIGENLGEYNTEEQNIISQRLEGLEEEKLAFERKTKEEQSLRDAQIEEERVQKESEHREAQARKIEEMRGKNLKVPLKKPSKSKAQEALPKEKSSPKDSSDYSFEQENALAQAKSYLDFSSFSRSGLVSQLEYEGFSPEVSEFAVGKVNVDWSQQAVKKAKSYTDYASFSRSGLIEQLEYEGFSLEDSEYAVDQIGY